MPLVWRGDYHSWDPSFITTSLWLDAADADTITETGGAVSQWDDKSPNAFTFSQGNGSNRPTTNTNTLNSKNVLTFNSTNSQCLINGDSLDNVWTGDGWHLFAVARSTNVGTEKSLLTKSGDSNHSENQRQFRWAIGENESQLLTYFNLSAVNYVTVASESIASNTYYMLSVSYDGTAGTPGTSANTTVRVEHHINGFDQNESVALSNGVLGTIQNGTARLAVGAYVGTAGTNYVFPFDGDIGELIALPVVASTYDRQLTEGYLAHKWGLTAGLPVGHPYKTTAPAP